MEDINTIENKTYNLNDQNGKPITVKSLVSELPNDMEMIAFISGELTNSATYCSSFADVTI